MKLYIFKSSRKSDKINRLTIWTNSEKKAIALAIINFAKHEAKGSPVRIAL
jgi:hypothetical protein